MQKNLDSKFYVNTLKEGEYQDREKTLLLVIDEQERLMPAMEEGELTVINTEALIKAFQRFGVKVIATEQYPKGLGRSDKRILDLLDDNQFYEKTAFNGTIPEIMKYITENAIENILVTGSEGHVCVYQTIRSLLDLGYNVFYIEDAISSYSLRLKDTAKESLRDMGAVIVNTEMVLFDLAKDSKDENFKFISDLVKGIRQ